MCHTVNLVQQTFTSPTGEVIFFWYFNKQRDTCSNYIIDSLVAINIVLLLSGQEQIEIANKNWFSPASRQVPELATPDASMPPSQGHRLVCRYT